MAKNLTGNTELDLVLSGLSKQFGKDIAHIGPKYESALPVSSTSMTFDASTGIGGIPKGRITEFAGPPSCGKTSLSLRIMSNYKQQYPADTRPMAIIDMERSISEELMEGLGLNPGEILFLYPDTAEEALESARVLNTTGAVSFILLDSVDAMQSENYLKKNIGDADMQGIAKLMGQALRQISKSCVEKDVTNLWINQLRDSLNMFDPKPTTSGGKALGYYASLRVQAMKQKESPNMSNAFLMRTKIVKNKCGPPREKDVEFDFIYARGPEPYFDLLGYAKSIGIIRLAGSAVKLKLPGQDETSLCNGGRDGARLYLIENPDKFELIRKACLNLAEPEDAIESAEL